MGTFGSDKQVHVICHQHVGMDDTSVLRGGVSQPPKVSSVVILAKEDGFPAVAALYDMGGNARQIESGLAGHTNIHVRMILAGILAGRGEKGY